jgi:hypothetical protein
MAVLIDPAIDAMALTTSAAASVSTSMSYPHFSSEPIQVG